MNNKIFLATLISILVLNIKSFSQNPHIAQFTSKMNIRSVATDDKYVWIGHENGLSRLEIATEKINHYDTSNSDLPFNGILKLALDNNNDLWIFSRNGIAKLSNGVYTSIPDTLIPYIDKYFYYSVAFDFQNNLWMNIQDQTQYNFARIGKFDGQSWSIYDSTNSAIKGDVVNAICFDSLNRPLISVKGYNWYDSQILYFDGFNWILQDSLANYNLNISNFGIVTDYNELYSFGNNRLYHKVGNNWTKIWDMYNQGINGAGLLSIIGVDKFHNIWFSYADQNFDYYHIVKHNGQTFTDYLSTASTFGVHHYLYSSTFDSAGTLWLGCLASLTNFKNGIWKMRQFGLSTGLSLNELAIDTSGNLFVASGSPGNLGSIGAFNGQKWKIINSLNNAIVDDFISMTVDINNNKWFLTSLYTKKLYKYNGSTFISISIPNGYMLYEIKSDKQNNIWGFNDYNVYKFNGVSWTVFDSTAIGSSGNNLTSIEVDTAGQIWLSGISKSTDEISLFKYDGATWNSYSSSYFKYDAKITCDAKNNIWVTNPSNVNYPYLIQFDGISWTEFSTANQNIPYDTVVCVGADLNGNVYAFVYQNGPHGKLLMYNNNIWIDLNIDEYLPNVITLIRADKNNNMYLMGYGSVTVFNSSDGGIDPPWASAWANGKVVYDANNNQLVDGTDAPMFGQTIMQLPDSTLFGTDNNGAYTIPIKKNNSVIKCLPTTYFHVNTDSLQYSLNNITTDSCCYDFGLYPDTVFDNAQIALSHSTIRCGFTIPFSINVINKGTTIIDGHVVLKLDTHYTVINVMPPPFSINADSIVWDVSNMQPYTALSFNSDIKISNSPGDTVFTSTYFANQNYTSIYSLDDDVSIITCSYDPNEKSVEPLPYGWANYVTKGSTLDYLIQFQNLGTDTAFNIVVIDTLSNLLDLSTIEVIGWSHAVQTEIQKNGTVIFNFKNIKLPHALIDEPGSHGYVKFRIKHKQGLADNTVIPNDAQIYFDFNDPIFTNNAYITLITNIPFSQNENSIENNDVLIYPQPGNNIVYFKLKKELVANASLTIYDVYGRQISENIITADQSILSVATEKLNNGLFIFELKTVDNNVLFTGKLAIQR